MSDSPLTPARRQALAVLITGERNRWLVRTSNATTAELTPDDEIPPGSPDRLRTLHVLSQTAKWFVAQGYVVDDAGTLTLTATGRQLAVDEAIQILDRARHRYEGSLAEETGAP